MARQVPRILPMSGELVAPDGTRFALLHVVAGDVQTAGIPGATAYTDTHDIFDFTK